MATLEDLSNESRDELALLARDAVAAHFKAHPLFDRNDGCYRGYRRRISVAQCRDVRLVPCDDFFGERHVSVRT